MRKLAVSAASDGVINSDRVAALQAEMDSSLQSISRIMETTNVAGQKLLGELKDEGKLNLGRIRREAEENDSGFRMLGALMEQNKSLLQLFA